jgi:hypothetical protein
VDRWSAAGELAAIQKAAEQAVAPPPPPRGRTLAGDIIKTLLPLVRVASCVGAVFLLFSAAICGIIAADDKSYVYAQYGWADFIWCAVFSIVAILSFREDSHDYY